jgi:hypothetical protein
MPRGPISPARREGRNSAQARLAAGKRAGKYATRGRLRRPEPDLVEWPEETVLGGARRPGSKFVRMNRCERSSAPLACGSRASRITHPTSS